MKTIRIIPLSDSLVKSLDMTKPKKLKRKLSKVDRSNRLKESAVRRNYDVRSDEEILEIRRLYESKEMTPKMIREKFDLSKEKLYQITNYATRGHLVPGIWKG